MKKSTKKEFFIVSIVVTLLFSQFSFALTKPTETTMILDNEKVEKTESVKLDNTEIEKEKSDAKVSLSKPTQTTVFMTDPSQIKQSISNNETYYSEKSVTFDVQSAIRELKKLDYGIDELTKQILDLDKTYKVTDTKYSQTRKEVTQVIADIVATKNNLEQGLNQIVTYQKLSLQSAQSVEATRKDTEEMKKYIIHFSTFLYKLNNELYGKDGGIDNVKLFLKSKDTIAHTLSNTFVAESLLHKLDDLMGKLEIQEKKQIKRIKVSNKSKMELKEAISKYEQQLTNLEQKRSYLVEFLKIYKKNKNKIEGTIASLFDTRKDTYQDIVDTIEQVRKKKYITSFEMKDKLKKLSKLKPYATYERSEAYSRPLLPVNKISSYFKDKNFKKKYGFEQYGIEVPATQMTPLYAVDDAIVYKINESDGIGINRLLLLHKDGTMSIYLYPTQFLIQAGDIVRRGQLIGYSGGEPGTKGAGFISQQPNLTLMIFKNNTFVDPLSVLDLSVFKNKGILSDKYHIKYLKDLYRRPRDIYKITFMDGSTLNQRRVQFLEKYGVGIYRELAFWQDAAAGTDIDLDLGICIGFAESTLGNHLSTVNNIGNVGNNDRGDRVSFGSALGGARLIYTTLNNAYLGHYNTIIELNGYGNKQGKIYASSPYNRQNNVVKCLSAIKGYYVPDDFPFRY